MRCASAGSPRDIVVGFNSRVNYTCLKVSQSRYNKHGYWTNLKQNNRIHARSHYIAFKHEMDVSLVIRDFQDGCRSPDNYIHRSAALTDVSSGAPMVRILPATYPEEGASTRVWHRVCPCEVFFRFPDWFASVPSPLRSDSRPPSSTSSSFLHYDKLWEASSWGSSRNYVILSYAYIIRVM